MIEGMGFRDYIERKYYIEKVKPYIKKNIIKVFVGQRRVGKSFLLYQFIDIIKSLERNPCIVYINKELDEFGEIKNSTDLISYVKAKKRKRKFCYLFVDEIQDIEDFEKAIRSLFARGGYDIYISGSNANLLSGELATYLSGRYIEIKVFGLSYSEFLTFHKLDDSTQSFTRYLRVGGLPYLIHLPDEDYVVYDYLRNIYNTIILKDVVARYNIRNVNFLDRLVRFLCDNTGGILSAKKISEYLKSQKLGISTQVVLNYLSHLVTAFLVFKVSRYDLSGKRIFEIGEKFYFEDTGIRNSIVGYKVSDISKLLENIVYLHLCMAGYNVTVGKYNSKEIDFVGEKFGEKIYVQVCYLLTDEGVVEREFGNLLSVSDNYPKYVVSMDEVGSTASTKGIKHIGIREFLRML